MAFDSANLYCITGMPPGFNQYVYKSDTDAFGVVAASGYFNNDDDQLNLAADDLIIVIGDEGGYCLRVDAVSNGVVTTENGLGGTWLRADITSVAATTSNWLIAPFDGKISRMKVMILGAVSDDTTIGAELGGTNVTDGGSADIVTLVASASAAQDVFSGEADTANAVSEGDAIEITCGGEGSTASAAIVLVEILPN